MNRLKTSQKTSLPLKIGATRIERNTALAKRRAHEQLLTLRSNFQTFHALADQLMNAGRFRALASPSKLVTQAQLNLRALSHLVQNVVVSNVLAHRG